MSESVETVHPCTGTECDHWSHWYGIERTDDTTTTDRTLYSINIEALSPIERELLEDWLELGRAVKVEPCVHGNVFPHPYVKEPRASQLRHALGQCDGKPEADK